MNNTALGILSAIFVLGGSFLLSMFTNYGGSSVNNTAQFSVMDGAFKTNIVDPFTFTISGIKPIIPASTDAEFNKLANYLVSNDNRILSLVGQYYSTENANGDTNLGIQRAKAIKAKLVAHGAPEESISTTSQRLSSGLTKDQVLYNPVVFNFMEKKTNKMSEVAPSEVAFSPSEPFTVRFDSENNPLTMTPPLKSYLDQALEYLGQNKGAVLFLAGYIGKSGSASSYDSRSRNEARTLREFLKKNGVKNEQIKIEGKGIANPVAPNDTEGGRALNNRVVITIQ